MTKGFREKLGQGGYGSVYKGTLRSGGTVAVKVLSNTSTANGQDHFINEVATIGRIHHVIMWSNLLDIVLKGPSLLLVCDLMSNGSLRKYIFCRGNDCYSLSWNTKYEIAVHEGSSICTGVVTSRSCISTSSHTTYFCTESFTPKISDFGIAKFYSTDKNIVTLTAAGGTIGYDGS